MITLTSGIPAIEQLFNAPLSSNVLVITATQRGILLDIILVETE